MPILGFGDDGVIPRRRLEFNKWLVILVTTNDAIGGHQKDHFLINDIA